MRVVGLAVCCFEVKAHRERSSRAQSGGAASVTFRAWARQTVCRYMALRASLSSVVAARKFGRTRMRFVKHPLVKIVAVAAVMFAAGFGAGTWRTGSAEAQNRFGPPKTGLHAEGYKWKSF